MHLSFLKKKLCNSELYFFFKGVIYLTPFDFSLMILVYSPVRYFIYKWLGKLNLNRKCMFTYSDVFFSIKCFNENNILTFFSNDLVEKKNIKGATAIRNRVHKKLITIFFN